MATYTKTFSNNSQYRLELVVNQVSQSIPNNTSNVSWSLLVRKLSGSGYWASGTFSWSVNIGGVTRSGSISGYDFRNYTTLTLGSGTVTISHNSDGTKTISSSGSFTGASSLGSATASGSLTLTTIPRASTFTLSGATSTNANVNVNISRKSNSFTHRVRWRVGSGSWTTVSSSATTSASFTVQPSNMPNLKSATITVGVQTYNGSTAIGSEATATRTITIPNSTVSISGTASTGSTQTANPSNPGGSLTYTYAWTLAGTSRGSSKTYTPEHSHLPNSTSGTLTVTLTTRNGTALINTTSATRTITVPSNIVPTISGITHSEQDSITAGLGLDKYVQGKSRIKIGVNASAGSGASISGYTIKVDGQTATSNNATTGVIKGSGTLAITATVTDSRGRTSSTATQDITVLPYSQPYLTGANAYRTTSSGERDPFGTYSRATFKMNATSLDGKNTLAYEVLTSEASGADSTSRISVGHSASNVGKTITTSVYSNFIRTKEYQYTVILEDKYGTYTFETDGLYIPTAGVNLAIGHGGVATSIGKLASHGDTYNLEVGDKGMRVDGPVIGKEGQEISYDSLYIPDTRNDNQPPSWYYANYPRREVTELKFASAIGLNNATGNYVSLHTIVRWSDTSGSGVTQMAYGNNNEIYYRTSSNNTSWLAWEQISTNKKGAFSETRASGATLTKSGETWERISAMPAQTITVSSDNATVMVMCSAPMTVNTQVGRLSVNVDGARVEGLAYLNNTAPEITLVYTGIVTGLSKGNHTVEMVWSTQSTSATATIKQYRSITLSAWEL